MKLMRNQKTFDVVVHKCPDTGLYVGCVPGFPGAHSQGRTLSDLKNHLVEVIEMLFLDDKPSAFSRAQEKFAPFLN
jgi:predicted RNase H-like HicB family nuclease